MQETIIIEIWICSEKPEIVSAQYGFLPDEAEQNHDRAEQEPGI